LSTCLLLIQLVWVAVDLYITSYHSLNRVDIKSHNQRKSWLRLTKKVRLTTISIVLVQTDPQRTDEQPRRRPSSLSVQHRRRQLSPTTPHRPPSPDPPLSTCAIVTALSIPSSIIASSHVVHQTGNGSRERERARKSRWRRVLKSLFDVTVLLTGRE